MPIKIIHETPVFVTLEGKIAFRFVRRENERAIYIVAGFEEEDKLIRVIDYRTEGLNAIDRVIETGSDAGFTGGFCLPARVSINEGETGVQIELRELNPMVQPELMLWIATGVEQPIPDYAYSFLRIEPFGENNFALVSIFNYRQFQAYFDGLVVEDRVENQS